MHVTKVIVQNYRTLRLATYEFGPGTTIIVGDNEAGKSTLIEAIHLALTGLVAGKPIRSQLHPYLFNRAAALEYAKAQRARKPTSPPEILIEVHLREEPATAHLTGSINRDKSKSTGVWLRIKLNELYRDEFTKYVEHGSAGDDTDLLAVEYFDVEWKSFADANLTTKHIGFRSQLIDPASLDPRRGTGRYISSFVRDLPEPDRIALAVAYRSMKAEFQEKAAVKALNEGLKARKGQVSRRTLSVAMDMTAANDWEQGISPMLDDIPFDLVGRGEQAAVRIWLALHGHRDKSHLVMVEEPENHLSFGRLNMLLHRMGEQLDGRQLIVTTHSSFVLNKLGLADLLLFAGNGGLRITELDAGTAGYFKKLPGHDTLRLVLAPKVILVEGPSDELVVQRAYRDRHGKRPIEAGVDVMAVGSLAFPRYLDLAAQLKREVAVVTDNDGDPGDVEARLGRYHNPPLLNICYPSDASLPTLEPQIAACNPVATLNTVLNKRFKTSKEAGEWMRKKANKTEAALRIHDSPTSLTFPEYILRAIG